MLITPQEFDAKWYLATYPDVAEAGFEPWQHYQQFGCLEGRLPFRLVALEVERQLWQTQERHWLQCLCRLLKSASVYERDMARWCLARWYASEDNWETSEDYLASIEEWPVLTGLLNHTGAQLLWFETLIRRGKQSEAEALLNAKHWSAETDASRNNRLLARSVLAARQLEPLNHLWQQYQLSAVSCNSSQSSLDGLTSSEKVSWRAALVNRFMPLVSVIIPCFNAQKTLPTALKSLLNQSYTRIEILIVDDASDDKSVSVIKRFAARDKRVKLLRHTSNQGAYAARNTALKVAKGAYITTHDSDDWSHPDKLSIQVQSLREKPELVACRSYWVRASDDLRFTRWRMEDGWIYPNISSLMFRRKVFKTLGFWDRVSVNADTEYYQRIVAYFGEHAVTDILPFVPLSIGRVDPGSLSQTSLTHLRTQFCGVRQRYQAAANKWHQYADKKALYMPSSPSRRPFPAPALIDRMNESVLQKRRLEQLTNTDAFDSDFYLRHNPDIQASGIRAQAHYLHHGRFEGRAPHPLFCASAYHYKTGVPPELAWFDAKETGGATEPVRIPGLQQGENTAPSILLVGHQVTSYQFGAERSLVTTARQLNELGYNVVLLLPDAGNRHYLDTLRDLCREMIIIPFSWWRQGRLTEQQQVDYIVQQIKHHAIQLVYANTAVLCEPLAAAIECNVPVLIHVREWITEDSELQSALNTDSSGWLRHVNRYASAIVTNSQCLAKALDSGVEAPVTVIPNTIDDELFAIERGIFKPPLRVGIVSSNIAKKGIADFFELAEQAASGGHQYRFFVVGPPTTELERCQAIYSTPNLSVLGYQENTNELYKNLDVVVNFSRFLESFGRTIAEGMAAGCTAIVYDQGALPDLLSNGGGAIIERGNIAAALEALNKLAEPSAFLQASSKARASARKYRHEQVRQQLKRLMSALT